MANMVGNPQMGPAQPMPTGPAGDSGPEPLTSSMLAAASPQEQKQMLGERLFPLIQVGPTYHMIIPQFQGQKVVKVNEDLSS